MWVRTQLKIGWRDLAKGLAASIRRIDRDQELFAVERYFSEANPAVATYSVRTGFDLLLQALELQPGDEVLFSALNVKGMVKVVKEAGLVPVPVDIDISQAAATLEALKAAITPRSKVFVAAHLFGTRADYGSLFRLAKSHGILAVEDCAQAFNGRAYPGSPDADLCLFSFGPIKTATALGGALICVRDPELCRRMRAIQSGYPMQPDRKQRKRILQFMALKLLTSPSILALIYRYFHAQGKDYEDAIADRVRDVAPLKTKSNLRFQPSATMLHMMNMRLSSFDAAELAKREARGRRLRHLLGDSITMPGEASSHHDYWVFPILVSRPKEFISALRSEGFDAADLPRSQHIPAPTDREHLEPLEAARLLRDLVIVPCYGDMPASEIDRLAQTIKKVGSAPT